MISLITSMIGVLTALSIFVLIRRDHLHVRYGIGWMLVALAFAMLGLFPTVFDHVAAFFGVAYPPVLAFLLGFVILLLKTLLADIERSKDNIKFQRMVQRVALLEAEIQTLRNELAQPADEHG
jgi:hypothetical protein